MDAQASIEKMEHEFHLKNTKDTNTCMQHVLFVIGIGLDIL